MVDTLAVGGGLLLTLVLVVLHLTKGTKRSLPENLADELLQRRASTVEGTDFPEPMSRAIGGGGGAVAAGGGASATEGEEEETGFDPSSIPDEEVEYYDVEFVKEGETIEVANTETLLEAGEDQGWDLPYACRQGQCLSCGGHIQDGDAHEFVRHGNNDTLSDDEMDRGYCLTCQAYPVADFSLETSETP